MILKPFLGTIPSSPYWRNGEQTRPDSLVNETGPSRAFRHGTTLLPPASPPLWVSQARLTRNPDRASSVARQDWITTAEEIATALGKPDGILCLHESLKLLKALKNKDIPAQLLLFLEGEEIRMRPSGYNPSEERYTHHYAVQAGEYVLDRFQGPTIKAISLPEYLEMTFSRPKCVQFYRNIVYLYQYELSYRGENASFYTPPSDEDVPISLLPTGAMIFTDPALPQDRRLISLETYWAIEKARQHLTFPDFSGEDL